MRVVTTTAWTKPSNIEVIRSDPESALAGCTPAQVEKEGFQPICASAESRDIGKLHLAGDDAGFGRTRKRPDWSAPAYSATMPPTWSISPAYAIDHEHTMHQLEDAEFYHPTKIEIISEIGDALCRKLGGHPFAGADE
jgi:hypothetical protein